jgi:hypothetical protein
MEEVEFQIILRATSFPVMDGEIPYPPMDRAPLKVAVPETVRSALLLLVPLIDKVAPEFTVRLLQTALVVPLIKG